MIGKKVLITGASGMLGSALIDHLDNKDTIGFGSEFDITDLNMVSRKLEIFKPDIIIHAAAYTDVEACEVNRDKAYKINTIGTQNLVNYCINKDVLFIYISSTGIYGAAKNTPYTEFDKANPSTIHHKSKYEGELVVQNHLNRYLILRTGWLYGGEKTHNKNFVYKRYLEACSNDAIYSDNTQTGNPTYTVDLVQQIELLIEKNQYGIFNCVNEADNVSRYDYVKKIVDLFDVRCSVEIAPNGMFARVAPVSNNESAINYQLNMLGLNIMGNWEESLEKYIVKLKSES
ncbi:MAG: NAD(P)-dependent oxidoreductase [Sulfurimonas sp.]|jgi:dTDP-4-dehydrorhamnose reductase